MRVKDFTYRELLRLDAGSWKSSDWRGERIPTLSEAIEVLRPSPALLPVLGEWADQVNPWRGDVDTRYVDEVHRYGMSSLVWTVDHAHTMRRTLRMGVDGVITNHPDRLRLALEGVARA